MYNEARRLISCIELVRREFKQVYFIINNNISWVAFASVSDYLTFSFPHNFIPAVQA